MSLQLGTGKHKPVFSFDPTNVEEQTGDEEGKVGGIVEIDEKLERTLSFFATEIEGIYKQILEANNDFFIEYCKQAGPFNMKTTNVSKGGPKKKSYYKKKKAKLDALSLEDRKKQEKLAKTIEEVAFSIKQCVKAKLEQKMDVLEEKLKDSMLMHTQRVEIIENSFEDMSSYCAGIWYNNGVDINKKTVI